MARQLAIRPKTFEVFALRPEDDYYLGTVEATSHLRAMQAAEEQFAAVAEFKLWCRANNIRRPSFIVGEIGAGGNNHE